MMDTLIFTAETNEDTLRAKAGGKARHMAMLERASFPVPAWISLSTEAHRLFLQQFPGGAPQEPSTEDEFEALERAFLKLPLDGAFEAQLKRSLESRGLLSEWVAVRSSAVGEDSAEASFAGQFSSFLFQKGWDAVAQSIKKCWASAHTLRASAYRREQGFSASPVRMGVVIQKMVNARCSGVAFSRHPIRIADRDQLLISSVWGLGEGLVSGELDADHFEVPRLLSAREDSAHPTAVQSHIVEKTEMRVMDAAQGGLKAAQVDAALVSAPSLTHHEVVKVAELVMGAEHSFGSAQDIEWAFEGEKLYCLQSRPITGIPADGHFDPRANGDEVTLWDNSNIIESYCGVTTPLTFSYVNRAYREVYYQFCRVMGVPEKYIAESEPVFRNMLGLIRGRVYYNLLNWYRLIFLFPGAATSKGFMETMMGVKQGLKEGKAQEIESLFGFLSNPPHYSGPKKAYLIGLSLYRYFFIAPVIVRFQNRLESICGPLEAQGFRGMSFNQQVALYISLEERLLKKWDAPIINDGRCMVAFGFLKALTAKWLEGNETLQNDLLCGEGDLKSTEPTKMLMRIAARVDQGPADIRQTFMDFPAEELWIKLQAGVAPEIYKLFREFLKKYGFRCVNELKLEEPDLHDDPSFVIESVRNYVRMRAYSVEKMETREAEIRRTAEAQARAKIGGLKRRFYFFILRWARRAVSDRENLRFDRTRVFGIVRHIFRAMGGNLVKMGLIEREEDVFYLTVEELLAFQEGRGVSIDFAGVIALRRKEFDRYRKTQSPPDRFLTRGAVGSSLRYSAILAEEDLLRSENEVRDPNKLYGTPCCPGIVEGVVRVAGTLKDAQGLNGEILVTERTDPGWVPLYPSCSGLLIERGSLLSHSAVVARELGLPTIVGISGGLLKRLKNGQRIRIDATKGEITLL